MNGKQQHKNAIVQNCCRRFIEDLLESSFISLSMVKAISALQCR
jgi:hypothetical protein